MPISLNQPDPGSGPGEHPAASAAEMRAREARALERVRRIAHWTDNAFRIPGTPWRFGLEPLIGLVPVAGDLLGLALTSYALQQAWTLGAPRPLLWRMVGNAAADFLIGLLPGVGDLGDAVFKANARNLRLLERHLAARQPAPPRAAWRGRLLAVSLWLLGASLLVALGWLVFGGA